MILKKFFLCISSAPFVHKIVISNTVINASRLEKQQSCIFPMLRKNIICIENVGKHIWLTPSPKAATRIYIRECINPSVIDHLWETIIALYYHTLFNNSIVLQLKETTQTFRRIFSTSIKITFSFCTHITYVRKYLT